VTQTLAAGKEIGKRGFREEDVKNQKEVYQERAREFYKRRIKSGPERKKCMRALRTGQKSTSASLMSTLIEFRKCNRYKGWGLWH